MLSEDYINIFSFKREIFFEMLLIVGMFLLAIVLVFYMPSIARDLVFLIIIYLFWKTKKDIIFFGFFFIIINTPAYFFDIFTLEARYRLPIYNVLPGISFNILDLFVIVAFIKSIVKNKNGFKFHIINSLFSFLIIAFVIGFFSALWFGTTVGSFLNHIRAFSYFTLIISFPILIKDKRQLIKFGYFAFPFLLLIFGNQVYFVLSGNLIISHFDPAYRNFIMINTISGDARPEATGILIIYYSLLFGFFLKKNKSYELFNGMANFFILIAFLCVFLSATRMWITSFILLFLAHLYFNKKLFKSAVILPYAGLLVFALLIAMNLTDYFIENVWSRYYSFIESLFSNQITNYDTLAPRINYSLPRILEAIGHSPFIGVGFSDLLAKHYDPDLGGLNTVLTFGVIGLIFFLLSYYFIIKKITFYLKNSQDLVTIGFLESIIIGFLGIFLGFFTTWDFFSFFYTPNVFFLCIFLGHAEISVRDQEETKEEADYSYLSEFEPQKI